MCHPGNCKPCEKENIVDCDCGREKLVVKCKDYLNFEKKCSKICNNLKNCGKHKC